jgi:ABC-type transport system involved in multi-copper enzyme maturation permease subunit
MFFGSSWSSRTGKGRSVTAPLYTTVATVAQPVRRLASRVVPSFPLLAKELTEQAARRRTYVLRAIYAAALYGFALWVFWNQLGSWSSNSFAILGRGRELFEALAGLQFAGLYLFLPAMTCGVLTSEKERDTLSLLLLTNLGPWTILLEKLLGRLVPMASFVLLSTPLLAVAYSLGGVETVEIGKLAWSLTVTAVQVGSLSLACSAWCRTTSAAFLSAYLVGAALILGPVILTLDGLYDPTGVFSAMFSAGQQVGLMNHLGDASAAFFGPLLNNPSDSKLAFSTDNIRDPWLAIFVGGFCGIPPVRWLIDSMNSTKSGTTMLATILRSVPIMMFSVVCLLCARYALWRRAFLQPSNYLLKAFKLIDVFFQKANQNRFTKGIVLTQEQVELPVYDPIRWRETKKRSLGTTRYLVRFLLLLEIPVVIAMRMSMFELNPGNAVQPVDIAAWALWIVAALVLTIQSTGLIGLERSRQTLDVLLTTTQSSDLIVEHKFAGVWRMIRTLWIPFATVYFFQIYCHVFIASQNYGNSASLPFVVIRAILAVAIYPSLIAWIGFHQGMRRRSQTQATLVTLGLLTAVCVIPLAVAEFALPEIPIGMPRWGGYYDPGSHWSPLVVFLYAVSWLSPARVLGLSPVLFSPSWQFYAGYSEGPAWLAMFFHFTLAGGLLVFLWARGMRGFARHVNRNDGQIVDDADIDRLSELRKRIVGSGVFHRTTNDK